MNDLWNTLGNVGERVGDRRSDRILSPADRVLIHDALFDEAEGEPIP